MDIYKQITSQAAAELESALRKSAFGGDVYLWAVPTTAERNGRLVVASDMPEVGARVVRPSDNHASAFQRWSDAPYSAFATIIWHACRHEPILPIH